MTRRAPETGLTGLALAIACAAAGCSTTGTDLLKAPSGLAAASVEAAKNVKLPKFEGPPAGSPVEIYTRIGRGAGLCWFGAHGELKATHIFHAEAQPASKGGNSEIVVHEKDVTMPNPRGARAFRVLITANGDNANIEVENLRFPAATGERMTTDVRRWARDDLTCHDDPHIKGWDAKNVPGQPDVPAKPAKGSTKGRDRKA